nr:uncharacterized protein LOC109177267 [Ipomoea batatas]
MINSDSKDWNAALLNELFYSRDVVLILQIPVATNFEDTWCWKDDIRGIYSVKYGYRLLSSAHGIPPHDGWMWMFFAPL